MARQFGRVPVFPRRTLKQPPDLLEIVHALSLLGLGLRFADNNMPVNIAMMATTTRSSIRVNPIRLTQLRSLCTISTNQTRNGVSNLIIELVTEKAPYRCL